MKSQAWALPARSVLLIFLFQLLAFTSCRVTLLPPYNPAIATQIENTSREVDKFYLTMAELSKPENEGRAYANFAEKYIEIEVELNSLLNKNKVRPLNEHSTRICEITLQLWIKYRNEHKEDNTISNGLIDLNRKTFGDLFYAMQVAEKGKEIAADPPK
ncbi:hypothetical protein [Mangrovibacterium sp.]|uniref:hypothetical protein n=1 Tax=Mangrovibacterium sp. TaxID=1961364 RepID=UPI0035676334